MISTEHGILAMAAAALPLALACGGGGGGRPDPGSIDGTCAIESRVGGFEVLLKDDFTAVQGQVNDAVAPARVPEATMTMDSCTLYRAPRLQCDETCAAGTTCGRDGACVPLENPVFVGAVTVEGLTAAVEMEPSSPPFFYTHTGALPHPGFAEGDAIALYADGAGDVEPLALGALGVAALELDASHIDAGVATVALDEGAPVALAWSPPANSDASTVHLSLNIDQHGGSAGPWIECEVADSGSFAIPSALGDELLSAGYSGFPSLTLTRRSADSHPASVGCIDLVVESGVTLDVEIEGLTSCSGPEDCPEDGETCRGDLTCGAP